MTPIKATIFILGSDLFAKEIEHYLGEMFKTAMVSKFGLRSDSQIYFVDDNNPDVLNHKQYLNKISSMSGDYYSIMGSGSCDVRKRMQEQIVEPILSFVHPRAINMGKVGKGTIMAPGSLLAPFATVGEHSLVNYNATIGHHTQVGSLSVIAPGAVIGGNCVLDEGVYVGANASIRENIKVGKNVVIGMGAIVTKDVPSDVTIIGINERL